MRNMFRTTKTTVKSAKVHLLIGLIFFAAFPIVAQISEIRLVDTLSGVPISDVHFYYGESNGFSNEKGIIEIQYNKDVSLGLSHLLYGKLTFSPENVANAIKVGTLFLEKSDQLIMPITILSKPSFGIGPEKRVIGCQDRLTHDAGAFIDQLPSISVIRKSGAYGFDPVMRGFKNDQLNIVMDGCVSALAACPNRMDPPISQIPVNMIEKVDVYKGPHALRFGNSFGGTINFKSFEPLFVEKRELFGRLTGSYESNGKIKRTEVAIGLKSKWMNWEIFGASSNGSDYKDGEGNSIPSEFQKTSVGSNLGLKLNKRQKLIFSVTKNRARDIDFPALPMDLITDDTWLYSARHSVLFPDRKLVSWKTSVYASDVDHFMDNSRKSLDPRTVNAKTPAQTSNLGGRSELKFQFDNSWLYAGADFKKESVDGTRTREMIAGPMSGKTFVDNVWQDSYISKGGLFVEYHLTPGEWHYTLSGRMEVNQADANNPDPLFTINTNKTSSTDINPAISIGASRTIFSDMQVSLWLGRAQRSGSLSERFINSLPVGLDPFEMIGNPEISPEVNNQFDVSLKLEKPKFQLDVNLFTSYVSHFISSEIREDIAPRMASSPGVRQFKNLDAALLWGAEVRCLHQLFSGLGHAFTMAFTLGENLDDSSPLPEIPPMEISYRLIGSMFKSKLKPEALLRFVTEQDRVSEQYGETITSAFSLINIGIAYKPWKGLSIAAGVQNMFDEAYYEHLNRTFQTDKTKPIYAPGRSFYVTGSISF